MSQSALNYVDQALLGTAKTGTTAWKFINFPLDKVHIRSKTGSAEVHGKQSTSWVASYDKKYVVLMMVTQAGTGSGTSGPAVRKIWEALYGIHGMNVNLEARRRSRTPSRRRRCRSSPRTATSCRRPSAQSNSARPRRSGRKGTGLADDRLRRAAAHRPGSRPRPA